MPWQLQPGSDLATQPSLNQVARGLSHPFLAGLSSVLPAGLALQVISQQSSVLKALFISQHDQGKCNKPVGTNWPSGASDLRHATYEHLGYKMLRE